MLYPNIYVLRKSKKQLDYIQYKKVKHGYKLYFIWKSWFPRLKKKKWIKIDLLNRTVFSRWWSNGKKQSNLLFCWKQENNNREYTIPFYHLDLEDGTWNLYINFSFDYDSRDFKMKKLRLVKRVWPSPALFE